MQIVRVFFLFFILVFFMSCNKTDQYTGADSSINPPILEESVQIFALGDSITAGYGLPLEESYPSQLQKKLSEISQKYKVINAGISGNTSAELLARLEWTLTDTRAGDIAILVIGGNDGLRGMSVADMEKNIQESINILKAKDMKVVLGGMQIPPNLGLKYARDFEKVYASLAKNNKDVYFLEFFLDGVAADRRYNISDGIHPNKEGYSIIVENLYTFLQENKIIGSK